MNEGTMQNIDNLIDELCERASYWTRNNCPHHASEITNALAALIQARAEWEKSR